jgi:hypothetical protein
MTAAAGATGGGVTNLAGASGGGAGGAAAGGSSGGSGGDASATGGGAGGASGSGARGGSAGGASGSGAGGSDAGGAAGSFTLAAVASCSPGGWCWSTPRPQGNPLYAIHGSSAADVWAVGDDGTIVHFDGMKWAARPSGVRTELNGVWAASASDAWAVGDDSVVLHWDGAAWSPAVGVPAAGFVWRAVWGAAANDVWIVGGDLSVSLPDGNGGAMLHWDGHTWTPHTGPEDLGAVWGAATGDVWGLGTAHGLYHWNGQAWSAAAGDLPQIGTAVWGSGAHDVWLAWREASPGHTDGTNVDATNDQSMDLYGLWGSSSTDVWAVGLSNPDNLFADAGLVLHWDGNAWKRWPNTGAAQLNAIWGSAADDVWAVSLAGDIVHWDGHAWSRPDGPPRINLYSGWASGPTDVYAFGYDRGGLAALHFDGQAWSKVGILSPTALGAGGPSDVIPYLAWGSGPADLWIGATDWEPTAVQGSSTGRSLFVHWDGRRWTVDTTLDKGLASSMVVQAMWGNGPNDVWAVGEIGSGGSDSTGGAIHWDGARWSAVTTLAAKDLADGFISVWSSGADDVWIGGRTTVHHWDGQSWTEPVTISGGIGYVVAGTGPNDVWAVGSKDDGTGFSEHWDGSSWQLADIPAAVYPNAVVATSPTSVWVKSDEAMVHWDGQAWTVNDAGTTYFYGNLWWDGTETWAVSMRGLIEHQ